MEGGGNNTSSKPLTSCLLGPNLDNSHSISGEGRPLGCVVVRLKQASYLFVEESFTNSQPVAIDFNKMSQSPQAALASMSSGIGHYRSIS